MIKPLYNEEELFKNKDEKQVKEEEKPEDREIVPKTSPKILVTLGFLLIIFISGVMGVKVLNAQIQKPHPSPQAIQQLVPKSLPKINTDGIAQQLLKVGEQAGAAVLGATVQFMQKTASQSAPKVASAAANLVLQSAVPALVDQVKKLPPDQQQQVKELLCK